MGNHQKGPPRLPAAKSLWQMCSGLSTWLCSGGRAEGDAPSKTRLSIRPGIQLVGFSGIIPQFRIPNLPSTGSFRAVVKCAEDSLTKQKQKSKTLLQCRH